MQYTRFTLAIIGLTPLLITPAPKQTAGQLIESLHRGISEGTITGNTSKAGGATVLKVIDNSDLGLTSIGGVPTPVGNEILIGQFAIFDTGDGSAATGLSTAKQLIAGGIPATNAPNGALCYIADQPNLQFLAVANAVAVASPVPQSSSGS